ncbi:MAG: enoyl-CoA hydratase/isomerase family protein [Pseudomonadota bacterium]
MIKVTRDNPVLLLTLARPEKANALTKEMLEDLADAVEVAAEDAATRAIVLTGEGKVFSAGADLEAARAGLATDPAWERLSGVIAGAPCLTIAALNGTVAGGAFGMVLAADLRVSVANASFFYPVMKLGFLPQPSDPPRLAALVGPARAKLILMAGQKIDALTALNFGLIDMVVDDPLDAARALAADASQASKTHVSAIKEMVPTR